MGNSCTLPQRDKVAIPSRIIQVQQKEVLMRKTRTPRNMVPGLKISAKFESSPIHSLKERPPLSTETQTASDFEEEYKNLAASVPAPLKYDLSDLEIGDYYLQKDYKELSEKFQKLQKKVLLDVASWEKVVVQMRSKASVQAQISVLYNDIDIGLKEYAYERPKVFEKMMKPGPPMKYRWSVWKNLLSPEKFFIKNLYERLKDLSTPHENQIKKDIPRTFPHEPYFASEKYNHIGQEQLFNTLKALSLYFPNVGYVQGMNFIMGFFLMLNGGNELEAFWVFVTLIRDHRYLMMGFFEKEFPLLEFYLYIFYYILEEELPFVHRHLKQQMIPDQFWVFKWFLTGFLYSLPQTQVVRIWDFIVNSGLFGVVQIAVALLKVFEKDILELDTVGMDAFLRHLKGEDKKNKKATATAAAQTQNKSNQSQSNVNINQSNNPPPQGSKANQAPPNLSIKDININNLDFENCSSICNETSEFNFNFKEIDIEEILASAEKVPLSLEKVVFLAQGYSEMTNKKLPEFYYRFLTRFDSFYGYDCLEKQACFQHEVDFYIMKSELTEKPSDEIVVSNLLDVENNDVLHHLSL